MRFLFVTFFNPDNIGVRSLGATLRAHGHDAHILQVKRLASAACFPPPKEIGWYVYVQGIMKTDFLMPELSAKERQLVIQAIREYNPDVLGYSGMNTLDAQFPDLAKLLREAAPQAFFVAGGVGPTLKPEYYLCCGVDAVMRGESEESIVMLANTLRDGADWHDVNNMCYLRDDTLVCNPLLPLPQKLDYPVPLLQEQDFSAIENDTYSPNKSICNLGDYIITGSRGCIGHCSYCGAPRLRKLYDGICRSYIRNRDLDSILQELKMAKQQGAYNIFFADDFFLRPADEMLTFFQRYKKEIGVPFSMYLHPQQLIEYPEVLDAAIDAGLRSAPFGLQHGSENFCRRVFRRKNFCHSYPVLVERFLARGIPVIFHLIEGVPQETEQDFDENLAFVAQFPTLPSRKPSVQFHVMFLNYIAGSALLEDNPGIENLPRSTTDWAYRCLLLDLRQMTDDARFAAIRREERYKTDILALHALREQIDNERHLEYIRQEAQRLKGKEVYFWGGGWVYQQHKHLFADCKPRAILIDKIFPRPETMDGIPVMTTEEVLPHNTENIPVVMFIRRKMIMRLLRNWQHAYTSTKDIVTCTEIL